jgi:hypothetical protein
MELSAARRARCAALGVDVSTCSSVTIDLDGARHYHAIHGLPPPHQDQLVATGLERFLALCADTGIRSTIFVVTADLEDERVRTLLRQAVAHGHEVASHSHHHHYDLWRRAPAEIEADLARSIDALTGLTGERPIGFRAPGYNQSQTLLDALERCGFAYDSSVLASPLYFAARAAAIAAKRLRGTPSASHVGDARDWWRSRPFRISRGLGLRPARSRADARHLIELPISAAYGVPALGTTLSLLGRAAPLFVEAVLRRPTPCVVELHAVDLCDASDVSGALAQVQPDVRLSLRHKRSVLVQVFARLSAKHRVMPLRELVRDLDLDLDVDTGVGSGVDQPLTTTA